jgi:hypothetical protein
MPDLAKITALETKYAEAEPAPENPTAPPPDGGSSGAGSAPADASTPGAAPEGGNASTSPGATIDHGALREKLERDRARREEKARRKKIEEDSAAAEQARKEAEDAKSKWTNFGKDKPFIEALKEAGQDPRAVFEAMKEEALKAGTPEAKIEAIEKAWSTRFETLEKTLTAEREARETAEKTADEQRRQARARAEHQGFVTDFEDGLRDAKYETLTDEYEPRQLFGIVQSLKANPAHLFKQAADMGVRLTHDDGTFTMSDILNVMKATQDRHFARLEEQRRKKNAAPQTSQASPQQPPTSKPTVNGTAERNAGNALGNNLAATRAADPSPRKETKEERLRRLGSKYG